MAIAMERQSRIEPFVARFRDTRRQYCTERARIATESYKRTEGEPGIIRAAKALEAVLNGIGVWIADDEILLGYWASMLRGVPAWPEFGAGPPQLGFQQGASEDARAPAWAEDAQQEMQELSSYWKGKNFTDRVVALLPEHMNAAREATLWYWHLGVVGNRRGRYLVDLPTVLSKGFNGTKKEAEEKLKEIDLEEAGTVKRQLFYQAVMIVCDAVNAFAKRYAAKAREMAREASGERREELEEIARVCERVPANPAETFHEALQASWFAYLIAVIETGGDSISFGRLDQILYSYYKSDIENGRLSKDTAQELVEEFLYKVNVANTTVNAITIGGQTAYGEDATNEMTYVLLDALEHVCLPEPQFAMRVHKGTPKRLLMRAIDVMRVSGGRPQLNNDDAIIPALISRGVPLKDARDYAVDGCQHFTTLSRKDHSAWFNLAKALDLALNNGVDRLTGKQIGVLTGDPKTFTSLDDVMNAYKKQLEYGVKMLNTESELVDALIKGEMCLPYASINVRGCMDRGTDVLEGGGRYNWTGMHGLGIATVANSLAAVKKVVFEEKKFSMAELTAALDKDFEGYEKLRQTLIQAPKWGNDDDYVDSLAVEVANLWLDTADKHTCHTDSEKPGPTTPGFHSLTFCENFGEATAATPDGRKARERVNDGIAPSVGTYKGGPTAVFRSAAKLDHARTWTSSFTLTINGPTEGVADLARTYLTDMGGTHLMGNLVSVDTLIDAKKHPEKYPDLLVRLAGLSGRFVELPEHLQDLIIQRAVVSL